MVRFVGGCMWAAALALSMAACGEAGADGAGGDGGAPGGKAGAAPDLAGKADGRLQIVARGPLALPGPGGRTERVTLAGGPVSWRFNGFGPTRVRVRVTSPDEDLDAYVTVLGPAPGAADAVVAFNDDEPTGERLDSLLEVTLDARGGYELLVGTFEQLTRGGRSSGRLEVGFECLEGCTLPQIGLDEMLLDLRARLGEDGLRALLAEGLPALFPDPDTAAAVNAQVEAALAAGGGLYPVVPLAVAGTAQGLFESGETEGAPPAPVTFRLDELLTRGCRAPRPEVTPVHPAVPGLARGSFADWSKDDCTLQRARDFADVLNNLALDNGSVVEAGEVRYDSVEDVFVALIESGHRIVVENSRYYANFLDLVYEGKSVVAPVWLDTGIPLEGGGTLRIPAPHTHHTIHVTGPLLNATVLYYLGVDNGVSFRAAGTLRPAWSGERTLYTYDSERDAEAVVRLMVTAARLRKKWAEAGRGLPAEGYGRLGVCNDSTAVLEYAAEGTVSVFPLAHPPVAGAAVDQIDQILAALPADLAGFDPAEAVRRIRTTLPYEDGPLPALGEQLRRLPAALGGR